MKKKSITGWVFMAVFGLLSVGCFACCLRNKVLAIYGVWFALLAFTLYHSDK